MRTPRTHCPEGHELTAANTYTYPKSGYRSCRECRRKWRREFEDANFEQQSALKAAHQRKWRGKMLDLYGRVCNYCGFSDERALQLDHIDGGGGVESRALGGSREIYKRALKYPSDYQLLCANCNWIKRVENKEYRKRE